MSKHSENTNPERTELTHTEDNPPNTNKQPTKPKAKNSPHFAAHNIAEKESDATRKANMRVRHTKHHPGSRGK
ncbi:MAG: hypothetical protein V4490_03005 [Pseudomonadota bacterium]